MKSRPRVAIVGAGVGGMTLAAVLTRIGVPCLVFEQAGSLTEAGAGVQLSPNGIRPLVRLGIGPVLRRHAVRITAMEVRSWRDQPISRTTLGEDCERRFAAPYYAMHRAHLHGALCLAAGQAPLRLGHQVTGVEERGNGARVVFADGQTQDADLVVGADGIRSVARTVLAGDQLVFSGLGTFRGLVPAARVPAAAREQVVRVWLGPGGHLVCYPVAGGELISVAATLPFAAPPDGSAADPAELRAAFDGWGGWVPGLIEAVDQVRIWALYDREPLSRWATDRITVLGDAAHPMLPVIAQGANQAVEDAMDLAACLVMCDGDVPATLARYAALRAPRTTAIQRQARDHAAALHLADGTEQQDRDRVMSQSSGLDDRAWLYDYRAGVVTAVNQLSQAVDYLPLRAGCAEAGGGGQAAEHEVADRRFTEIVQPEHAGGQVRVAEAEAARRQPHRRGDQVHRLVQHPGVQQRERVGDRPVLPGHPLEP
jgi:salicylate hydroxylase